MSDFINGHQQRIAELEAQVARLEERLKVKIAQDNQDEIAITLISWVSDGKGEVRSVKFTCINNQWRVIVMEEQSHTDVFGATLEECWQKIVART